MRVLRSPRADDADALYALLVNSPVVDTLLWDGPTSFEEYVTNWRTRVEANVRREQHLFTIVDAAGQAVGTAALRPMPGDGDTTPFRADIGLWVGLPYQGRGLGTSAVCQLVEYGFGTLALEKIEASVFVGNVASRRIFEKTGFALEGTIRRAVRKRGRFVDEWIFGLVR